MTKHFYSRLSLLVAVLLVFQMVCPMTPVFASTGDGIMLPPSNLAFQLLTPDDVKLTWSAVNGAAGYNVYEIADGQLVKHGTTTSASYTISDLAEGSYIYVVSTLSPSGESGPCPPIAVGITYPDMAAPATLTNTVQNVNDILLSWATSEYAQTYNVYEIAEDGQKTLVSSTANKTYTVANVSAGAHTYAVSAVNSLYGESSVSPTVQVSVTFPTMAAPANFTATVVNGNDVLLRWNSTANATNYKVYQVIDGQKVFKDTVSSTTITYTNGAAGEYTYVVHSNSNRFGESAEGSQVSVTVGSVTMAAPNNFTYKLQNVNDILLTWNTVPYASSYKVYQVIDGQKVLKSTVTSAYVTYTNMPAGDYTYVVHAYSDKFGESAEGSQVSLTVDSVTMAAPNNLTYKLQNINDIVLTWGAVTNANSYKVYQIIDGQKVLKSTVSGTSVTYTNMPGGDYVYVVHSYSTRFGESTEGSQVSLTVETVTMEAPGNFTYNIQSGNDIVLTWDAAANANSYKVYQVVNGQKVLKSNISGTTTTYSNMAAGNYTYMVHSYSTRFGESAEGSQVAVTVVHPVMQPPTNLTQTVKNATDFTLNWDASLYASNYKVYQIVNGQKVLKTTVTGTTATITNMPTGDHLFQVHSYSSRFGESAEGSQVTVSLKGQVMEAPTGLSYTITSGNDINLKWTAAPSATSYKVYQVIDGQKSLQKTVYGTTVTFSNMPAGDYAYVIHSVSTLFGDSPSGAEITVTLVHPIMAAPGNFAGKTQNGNDIVLTWDTVQYASSYKVYELIDGQKVLKVSPTTLSTTLSNVSAGEHTYVIHSVSSRFGESAEGSQVSQNVVFPIMEAPTNLTQSIASGNDIILKWDAAAYATSYKVYQIVNGQKVLKNTATSATTTFSNMPQGDYEYEVHAFSARFGESAQGTKITFNLVHPVMQAPDNLTKSIANGNDIVLKWDAAAYATSYKVYQIVNGQKVLKATAYSATTTFVNMPQGDYEYKVHAVSTRFGESAEGSQITFNLVHPIMQAPGNFTKSIANGNDIVLKWDAASYATTYKVYQVVNGQKVLKSTITGTTATYTNMPQGDYKYVVHSVSTRFGESPEAGTMEFTLTWPVVQPPAVTGTVFNINNITLSWPTVTWANEYRVYEIIGETRQLLYKGTALNYKVYNMSEATHSYEVTAFSTRFGESAVSNRITETIVYPEMQAPTATLTLLDTKSARISWNFVAYANSYNIYEIINGTPVSVVKNVNNLSYTLSNLTYANHEYYVTAFSNSFGETDPSNIVLAKLIVDTEAPVTTANAPTAWINQNTVVTLSATDDETGVEKTFYSVNDGAFVQGTTITINEEGITKVSFYSVDKVGNTENTKTIEVKIDKTAPKTAVSVPTSWSKEDVLVSLTAADPQSGIAKTFYAINGADYVEGTALTVDKEGVNQISFYSVDNTGNVEKAQTVEVKIDKTAPVTASNAPASWSREDVTVNLTAADAVSGVAKTFYSINGSDYVEGTVVTVNKEGISQVSFYSADNAGHIEKTQTVEVKIDKTAPTTSAVAPIGWSKEDITVNLTAEDTQSGVAKTFYAINNGEYLEGTTITIKEEGINKVSFYSVDTVGNIESTQTIEIKVDKTAPMTASNAPTNWSKEDVIINLTAADAVSGVAKTFYSINGADYVEGTTLTVDKEGVNQISFYSVDNTGNIEKAQTVEVKIDKTAPVTASNAPANWSKEDVTVNLTAADAVSGVAKTFYSINGADYVEGITVTISKQGINQVSFYSVDNAGNIEKAQTIEVKVDKTVPTVDINLEAEYKLGTVLQVDYLATDNESDIVAEKMIISYGNKTIASTASSDDTIKLNKPGAYTVTVTVTNGAGLSTTIQKRFEVYIPISIEVTPKVIKGNKGVFTVRVELPGGYSYNIQGLDLDRATLNGVKALNSNNGYYNQAKNGQFKFERSQFDWNASEMVVEFRCYVFGYLVVGKTTVQVQK